MTRTIHLKDNENRVHESCGFARHDRRLVRLPGHVELALDEFTRLAILVITGGGTGWEGVCPAPTTIAEAIKVIGSMNPAALSNIKENWVRQVALTSAEDSDPQTTAITDEDFGQMMVKKFQSWAPTSTGILRLPKPVRDYIERLKDSTDPESLRTQVVLLESEIKEQGKKVDAEKLKAAAKVEQTVELKQYIEQLEAQIKVTGKELEKRNDVCDNLKEQLATVKSQAQELESTVGKLRHRLSVLSPGDTDVDEVEDPAKVATKEAEDRKAKFIADITRKPL